MQQTPGPTRFPDKVKIILQLVDMSSKTSTVIVIILLSTILLLVSTDSVAQQLTTVGNTCSEWTEWMDDENGGTLDPTSIGEFELIDQLRGAYGFCDEPTDIECALADDTNTPYDGTGQVSLTCDLQQGFLCFHSQQSGDCFNYAIRVLCPAPCQSLLTPTPTPVTRPTLSTQTSTPVTRPSLSTQTSMPVTGSSLKTSTSATIAGVTIAVLLIVIGGVVLGVLLIKTIKNKGKRMSKVNSKEEN